MQLENLFENIVPEAQEEQLSVLLQTPGFRLERIVSTGQSTPAGEWYNQDRHEWVSLLSGSAVLQFAEPDATLTMKPGDWLALHYDATP